MLVRNPDWFSAIVASGIGIADQGTHYSNTDARQEEGEQVHDPGRNKLVDSRRKEGNTAMT